MVHYNTSVELVTIYLYFFAVVHVTNKKAGVFSHQMLEVQNISGAAHPTCLQHFSRGWGGVERLGDKYMKLTSCPLGHVLCYLLSIDPLHFCGNAASLEY